ncbi:phage neck terminator protein [Mesorhizobium sp. P5_C1]
MLSPSQSTIQTVLRLFLLAILPAGVEVVSSQDNRVPEPAGDFVTMTVSRRGRLSTNVDTFQDCAFEASITDPVMTVTQVEFGTILAGATVFGTPVAAGTLVGAQTGGTPGGIGTYTVAPAQTVTAQLLACGAETLMQPTEVVIQLDVHSATDSVASDMAQVIATLMRDERATDFFAASGIDAAPFYADDPKQVPFFNGEQQYETRYVVDVHIQANQALGLPQQFADEAVVHVVNVDATFPV